MGGYLQRRKNRLIIRCFKTGCFISAENETNYAATHN